MCLNGRANDTLSCGKGPLIFILLLLMLTSVLPTIAAAHGIAGNRFFPGTLTFDDPAVADEAILPLWWGLNHPDAGGQVSDENVHWSFFRLLTSKLEVGVDSGWLRRDWGSARRSGFDVTSVELKGEVYRDDLHETLVAASLGWGFGHTGAQGVGANSPNFITSGVFFGKGFGDLPDSLAWLRPFAITGAVSLDHPTATISTNFEQDFQTGLISPMLNRNADILHWVSRSSSAHSI